MAKKVKQEEVLYNEKGERVIYRDAPKKKGKLLPGCLGLVLLMIIIGACSAFMGGGEENKTQDGKETTTSSKEEKKKAYKIGDVVKVGKMQYKVNGVSTGTAVGPSSLPTKAKDTFVIVDIEVKNNGDEAITVDSALFKLKTKGKTLEADSAASMSANQGEDGSIENSFFLEQLNPDSTTKGKVVYDVSKAMADSPEKQLEVATGFFGTETDLINLK
ncbi:DUF4352 domain-containing protein [Macrococcoides caseolyticum]|uniref:DUF4352 domain-containing protein n=1 Tax=Macrococcoides caseolyticum TaxID=69966 RepID=UPI001F2EA3D0|nr:DUF4352 domain-containing protein [Macrococcus caseolyticus]MCE4957682.1 DUF4352 domain-containing protein [Macrococcus caseolyticus]